MPKIALWRESFPRPWRTALASILALSLAACSQHALWARDAPDAPARNAPPVSRLHVVMINGGGTPPQNYQSHLLHVRHLMEVLKAAGVPNSQITIFSADGPDPTADVATREVQTESAFWLVGGTRLEGMLRPPITYTDGSVPSMTLRPATRPALREWFDAAGKELKPGDVLLLYVTDHGNRNPTDIDNNTIQLWGRDETLSVRELEAMLAELDPKVRVVALMSQCFSGSFANLMNVHLVNGEPSGVVCGYFASTPDRRAYGCYPENLGRENVGHSFHFIDALALSGRAETAHAQVLVRDGSPDVPLTTSDFYLQRLLRQAAMMQHEDYVPFVDALLKEAWRNKGQWEPQIRLLDRIGATYGSFSPRSLSEVEVQANSLPEISNELNTWGNAWRAAYGDNSSGNIARFLAANPDWLTRLNDPAIRDMDAAQRRALTAQLLAQLEPFTRADEATLDRLELLDEKYKEASAAAYRMEVRIGIVLRMRLILTTIAGRVYLETRGTPAERSAYEALVSCEDLALPVPASAARPMLVETEPYPPFDEDIAAARDALPSWMGIRFRDTPPDMRTKYGLKEGAAAVVTVYPDSPAATAGLALGDVVLGPPNAPFADRNQIRTWTMLSKVDQPRELEVLRGDEHLVVTLVPKPYPMKWPDLPGPPKVSSVAPPLKLTPYRGEMPTTLADGKPHLLFFWATWCMPCKASLPELMAFERDRGTSVIAITDELPEQLNSFFEQFKEPFPERVAVDEYRRDFLAYGVSGTPTFVLIDGDGTVRSYATGYSPEKGLAIDGWKWEAKK